MYHSSAGEMNSEECLQLIEQAQGYLDTQHFDEAIQEAVSAASIALSGDEIFKVRILLIQAHFALNHFDEVCSIIDEMTSHPLPLSFDNIALMMGLSCLGAVHKYQRARTIKMLTNSAESVCRFYFDAESGFSDLGNVAIHIVNCDYGEAIGKLGNLEILGTEQLKVIVDNLTNSLMVEYVSSYSRVPIDRIAQEFGFTENKVVQKIEHLIRNHPRLGEYRIDARSREIHRLFQMKEERLIHLNSERQKQSREIIDELTLFNWRLITATGKWIIGKDVSP